MTISIDENINDKKNDPKITPEPTKNKTKIPTIIKQYERFLNFSMCTTIGFMTVVFAIPFTYILLTDKNISDYPFLLLTACFGALGAFFSALIRVNKFVTDKNAELTDKRLISELSKWSMFLHTLLRPMIGFLAAIILYFAVLSGVLGGDLFPAVRCSLEPEKSCQSYNTLLYLSPDSAKDFAKFIVWGFIAGFSERFIPDILEDLAKKSSENEQKT